MTASRFHRILAATAALAIGFTGALALAPAGTAAPAKKTVTLTVTELPAQVRLHIGEAVSVRLVTNVTTGHSWSTKVRGNKAAVQVGEGAYTAPDTELVGAPGTTTWTVTARADGTAVVKFLTTPPGGGRAQNVGSLTVIVHNH